jgi:uncharacterized membrane protein
MTIDLNKPLVWCWLFVAIGLAHVLAALMLERWDGLAIALFGLAAVLAVTMVIQRRRYKNLHPENQPPGLS